MIKRTPSKPTTPFGTIDFSKSGQVKRNVKVLPNDKRGQESEIAHQFVLALAAQLPAGANLDLSQDENDHDFAVVGDDAKRLVTGQLKEIVLRDFTTELSDSAATEFIARNDGTLLPVTSAARDNLILAKIQAAISKNYSKPKYGEFWLVIWSVTGYPLGSYIHRNEKVTSVAISIAQSWLQSQSLMVFDRIYLFEPGIHPQLIWSRG